MREALSEIHRILRPGGHLVLVLGNSRICGKEFPTTDFVLNMAADLKMKLILQLNDDIRSRGLMTKRNATAGLIAQETVIALEKR